MPNDSRYAQALIGTYDEGPTDWQWPGSAAVAVSITFDVDGETPYLGMGSPYDTYLATLSDGRFGITRGLPRILAFLDSVGIKGSFFVPGEIARRYPQRVRSIHEAGHEIGHHGFLHKPVHKLSDAEQKQELDLGLESLEAIGVPRPRGYRSPSWEITPTTFQLIHDNGFLYDSSFMGDDRPYYERHGELEILELPVSWTLDDWPLVGWSPHFPNAKLGSPDVLLAAWLSEYREARAEGRHASFTMHPEVIGRSSRFAAFRTLVETISRDDGVWFATMEEVALHVAPRLGGSPAKPS